MLSEGDQRLAMLPAKANVFASAVLAPLDRKSIHRLIQSSCSIL